MESVFTFFDDYFLTARPNTTRKTFAPQRIGVYADERLGVQTYTSFFFDPKIKKFRLYVEVPHDETDTEIRDLYMIESEDPQDFPRNAPSLIPVKIQGLGLIHGCSVFYDKNAQSEKQRYIFVGNIGAEHRESKRLIVAFSADGITFTTASVICNRFSDTYNCLFYDNNKKRYCVTMRRTMMDRRIFVTKSSDLIHWDEPQLLLHPYADGNKGLEYYAFGVSELDGAYYGINWRFETNLANADYGNMLGDMENELYFSYDGECFTATPLSPLVSRPPSPQFGCKQMWLLNITSDQKDKWIICGGAARLTHGIEYNKEKFAATAFYEIRKHGFVAIEGKDVTSRVCTKPFVLNAPSLTLNANATNGSVSVAVLDGKGMPIEGFTHEDFVTLSHVDGTTLQAVWKKATLSSLVGKRIRFEIQLNDALLFSLTFDGSPALHEENPIKSILNPALVGE